MNANFGDYLPKIVSLEKFKKSYKFSTFSVLFLPQFEGFTYPNDTESSESILAMYDKVLNKSGRSLDFERLNELHLKYSIFIDSSSYFPKYSVTYYSENDNPRDSNSSDWLYFHTVLDNLAARVPFLMNTPRIKVFDELSL